MVKYEKCLEKCMDLKSEVEKKNHNISVLIENHYNEMKMKEDIINDLNTRILQY